jgi:hypothetical protein
MSEKWTFGEAEDFNTIHKDGSITPSRSWVISLNGEQVGSVEIAMKKKKGKPDISFTITPNLYEWHK